MAESPSIQDIINYRFDNLFLGLNRGQEAARGKPEQKSEVPVHSEDGRKYAAR